jgi:DNA-binding response OmpR family regulator
MSGDRRPRVLCSQAGAIGVRHGTLALVVDDDVHIRAMLAELLEEEGYDVLTASNGFSGLRMLQDRRPRLLLLDLALPELSGIDVLHEVRASPGTRDTAVVVVTAHRHRLTEADAAEVEAVLDKPFDVPDLLARVHQVVYHPVVRRSEVAPFVAAPLHVELGPRSRRPADTHHTRRH